VKINKKSVFGDEKQKTTGNNVQNIQFFN